MRDEREMTRLILKYAVDHDLVRAVVLNGSRVNPRVLSDSLQDYDVVYFVTDVEPFRRNPSIVSYFGQPMIVQLPDDMEDPPPDANAYDDNGYCYLMQFMDGTRVASLPAHEDAHLAGGHQHGLEAIGWRVRQIHRGADRDRGNRTVDDRF
jgi:hypothetical protein